MFPEIATINSAPFFRITSRTCKLNFSFPIISLGSSDNEYCVFAIHTGKFDFPNFSICLIDSNASSEYSTSSAP